MVVIKAGFVAAILLFTLSIFSFASSRIDFLVSRYTSIFVEEDASTSDRLEIWKHNLKNYPNWWIMGTQGYQIGQYPHNSLLEFATRFGVLGVVIWLYMAYQILRFLMRKARGNADLQFCDLAFAGLVIFAFGLSQTSMSLEMNRMLWLSFGYVMAQNHIAPKGRRRSRNLYKGIPVSKPLEQKKQNNARHAVEC